MNWKIGDLAIIVHFEGDIVPPHEEKFIGEECEIIGTSHGYLDWEISVCGTTKYVSERHLIKRPYDGNELCEWSDCIFQPKVLELVE
jgi:hypothetical protein